MKTFLSIISILIFSNALLAQVKSPLQTFLNTPELKYASIGICIKDMSGKNILVHNQHKSLTPASILKIITTATAMETLGADFKFETHLAVDKNNRNRIIVHGYGDPTLGSEYLYDNPRQFLIQWKEQIKSTLGKIPREILIRDDLFGYSGVSEKWLREDMGNYYAAAAYGISIYDNTYRLILNSTNTESEPSIVKATPQIKDIVFQNNLKKNTTGQDNGYILGEPFSNFRQLIGDIPTQKVSFSIKGDIPNPGLLLGNELAETLGDTTIKIETSKNLFLNKIEMSDESIFYKHRSKNLAEIIRIVNVRSNNHYAEHIIRMVGIKNIQNSDINPLHSGIQTVKKNWKELGLDTDGLFMYDGSGLAPSNAVTPSLMCDILAYMYNKSKYSNEFIASLPKAGEEGTVKNFLKGSKLQGKTLVKSGSIANVQCFSGYYLHKDKQYVFTVMINKFSSSRRNTVKAIETLLNTIFE